MTRKEDFERAKAQCNYDLRKTWPRIFWEKDGNMEKAKERFVQIIAASYAWNIVHGFGETRDKIVASLIAPSAEKKKRIRKSVADEYNIHPHIRAMDKTLRAQSKIERARLREQKEWMKAHDERMKPIYAAHRAAELESRAKLKAAREKVRAFQEANMSPKARKARETMRARWRNPEYRERLLGLMKAKRDQSVI